MTRSRTRTPPIRTCPVIPRSSRAWRRSLSRFAATPALKSGRELKIHFQIVPRLQFGEQLCAQAIPYLRRDCAEDAECLGLLDRLVTPRSRLLFRRVGLRGWSRLNTRFGSARSHRSRNHPTLEGAGACLRKQRHAWFERHLFRRSHLREPNPVVCAIGSFPRCEPHLTSGHEFDDAGAEHRVRVNEPCQRTVQKALPQACQRPRPGLLQCWRPFPFEVSRADRFVEERIRFQRGNNAAAERFRAAEA